MQSFVLGGYLLQTTKERMSLNTSKKDICKCKRRNGRNRLCSIHGRSSPDFGKIKILSKHLLPQGEGVLATASLIAAYVQCRPDFPLENLIHGRGSCLPTSLLTGFSEWGLSHISYTWNSSPHEGRIICQDGRGRTKWQPNYNPEETADVKPGTTNDRLPPGSKLSLIHISEPTRLQ